MSGSKPGRSKLHHFAAVPHRAFGDKRLKPRHFRVLGAICIAVDRETGHSLISQARIAHWANISRQYVTEIVRDLESWGYIKTIKRGRTARGKLRTHIYLVKYDSHPPAPLASGDDMVHAAPAGDRSLSPTEGAESDSSESDIQKVSDSAIPVTKPRRDQDPGKKVARHTGDRVTQGESANQRQGLAKARAKSFERELRSRAEKRLCEELFKAFPGNEAVAILQTLNDKLYELAVDTEMRQKGAGVTMAARAVRRAIEQ